MIVRILSKGSSFKGLSAYLTHDPDADTAKRVAWTHTLNLANDHVPSAVDEMIWTAREAELLKQQAGIRAGGRQTGNAVKHLSLNWSPEDSPTREHMIETTEDFLRHMKWDEYQAVVVAHNDRPHAHVHIMLNVVHPETGLRLDDGFERRHAQAWALDYERENGRIYCEQRLQDVREREDAPTRPVWIAFKEKEDEFERDEKYRRSQEPILVAEPENPADIRNAEWKRLKEIQRHQREAFFAEGKLAFAEMRRSVYREIREEYRESWSDLYAARKNGLDDISFAQAKAGLADEQKAALEERRDEAYGDLRQSRAATYRDLLDDQRDIRSGLRARQEAGLDNAFFLDRAEMRSDGENAARAFGRAADEALTGNAERGREADDGPRDGSARNSGRGMKSGLDVSAGVGLGIISLFSGIADGLVGAEANASPRAPEPEHARRDLSDTSFADARRREEAAREDELEESRRRQRSPAGE